jgi:hypothetical protein
MAQTHIDEVPANALLGDITDGVAQKPLVEGRGNRIIRQMFI